MTNTPTNTDEAILLLGHGSLVDPSSAQMVYTHAARLRERFERVGVAFWKEPPFLHEAILSLEATRLTILPLFLSRGYFTEQLIPKALNIEAHHSPQRHAQTGRWLRYMPPLGDHPEALGAAISARVDDALTHLPVAATRCGVLLAAHGTTKNKNSAKAALAALDQLKRLRPELRVAAGFIDQAPSIEASADALASIPGCEALIVVPFFVSEGMHVLQDLPKLLGDLSQTHIHITEVLGESQVITQLLSDAARVPWPELETKDAASAAPLALTPQRLGQALIQYEAGAWTLRHIEDEHTPIASLQPRSTAQTLRELLRFNAQGSYRPHPYTLDLPTGWIAAANTEHEAKALLQAIYPMAWRYLELDRAGLLPIATAAQASERLSARFAPLKQRLNDHVEPRSCQRCALAPRWAGASASPEAPPCPQLCPIALEELLTTSDEALTSGDGLKG